MASAPREDSPTRRPEAGAAPADAPESSHGGARGVARRIDDLGRVVIPKEYRNVFGIRNGDLLDMTLEGDGIVLRRLESSCVFCTGTEGLAPFRGRLVCGSCRGELRDELRH